MPCDATSGATMGVRQGASESAPAWRYGAAGKVAQVGTDWQRARDRTIGLSPGDGGGGGLETRDFSPPPPLLDSGTQNAR